MTNNQDQPNDYQQYLSSMDARGKLSTLVKTEKEDPREDKKKEAFGKLQKELYDFLPENLKSAHPSPEKLNEELLNTTLSTRMHSLTKEAGRYFNLESIVRDIPEKTLDRLLKTQYVDKHIPAEDKPIVNAYKQYIGVKDFMSRYESGGAINPEEQKVIYSAAAHGAGEIEAEKSQDRQGKEFARAMAAAAVAQRFVSPEKIKEFAKKGLEVQAKEAEESYKLIAKGKNIQDIVRGGVKALAEKNFPLAFELVYRAERDKLEEE